MESGRFRLQSETDPEVLEWGQLRWLSTPKATGAKDLTVIDVELAPGKGHDFHKHPDQEEVIYVISGTIEQWVDRESKELGPGDSCFVPADMVHASINVGDRTAKLLAILGPCVGEGGYELVDVANDMPWRELRQ